MSEHHADTLDLFLSPQGNDAAGDGTSARPFATLERAVAHLGDRWKTANHDGSMPRHVEFVNIRSPGAGFELAARPRFHYFVDPFSQDSGDGTDASPWPSYVEALDGVLRRHGARASLAHNDRVRISTREVFTATSIEARKHFVEGVARFVFMLMALSLVVPLVGIFSYLLVQAWPSLTLSFLLENPKKGFTAGGIWAPLVGTFYLVFLSLLAAAPIGVLAGVYLNEYARDNWLTRMVNLAVVNLAGVPSIVHALFGVGAFVALTNGEPCVIAASLTLAVMTLPVIITSTREALGAVPMSFREACWNMGASRWQTIRTLVLPNSIGGILTGVILQVSRAAGETAPILFTGAVLIKSRLPSHGIESVFMYPLDETCLALSYHLYQVANNVPGVPPSMQYSAAVVLIGLVLVVNSMSIGLRAFLRSRKKW